MHVFKWFSLGNRSRTGKFTHTILSYSFLLIGILLLGAAVWSFNTKVRDARKQRQAVDRLVSRGWEFKYDWEMTPQKDGPRHPDWPGERFFRQYLGNDYYDRVVYAMVEGHQAPNSDDLHELAALKDLQTVVMACPQMEITDVGIQHIARLSNLRGLMLDCSNLSERNLRLLKQMKHLKKLMINGSLVSVDQ